MSLFLRDEGECLQNILHFISQHVVGNISLVEQVLQELSRARGLLKTVAIYPATFTCQDPVPEQVIIYSTCLEAPNSRNLAGVHACSSGDY